jgi:hypothetical protein
MGSAHHHRNAGGADGVGYAVGFGDHAGHGADPYQADLVIESEPYQLVIVHGLGVAVDQQDLVLGGRQRLQQEHPQVRHEVPGYPVIRVIQEDLHRNPFVASLLLELPHSLADQARAADWN